MNKRTCAVTGAAGFIGSHLCRLLLDEGWQVLGIDGFTDSYDPAEKRERAATLANHPHFSLVSADLADLGRSDLSQLFARCEVVFHLAARAGVRRSFDLGHQYRHDNVAGTLRVVGACRDTPSVRRLVYASSSSVYGDGPLPFIEDGPTDPISPYGLTKLAAENLCLEAHGPSLETVALRYFTVYGPGQRPDMALRIFAEAAIGGRPLRLLGDGSQSRDFTYVEDAARATRLAADSPAAGLAINVGGGSRATLNEVIVLLDNLVGRPSLVERDGFARGDVRHTSADLSRAAELLGFHPVVPFESGFAAEVAWLDTRRAMRISA